MRKYLDELVRNKSKVSIYFPASSGSKLVSASGIIVEVGDDFIAMSDIYGNNMLIPLSGISYIEVKK